MKLFTHNAIYSLILRNYSIVKVSKQFLEIIPDFPVSPENFEKSHFNVNEEMDLSSVTQILSKTTSLQSLIILQKWRKKKIKELGEIEFESYMKDTLDIGSRVHFIFDQYLEDKEMPFLNSNVEGFFKSAKEFLTCSKSICGIEKTVSHKSLMYKGILDNIIVINDAKEIIEFKTKTENRRISSLKDTYDDPLQLAAYIGAYNFGRDKSEQINRGRLLYVYKDGYPATDFLLHGKRLEQSWDLWKKRLLQYFENQL